MDIPQELRYSSDHEWMRTEGNGQIKVGITDYAQDALGDVVFVEVPSSGDAVSAGSSVGEVESTKSVSDIYCPLDGTISEVNEDLVDAPERLNGDPYGEGWIFVIDAGADVDLSSFLDADAYRELTEG